MGLLTFLSGIVLGDFINLESRAVYGLRLPFGFRFEI